MALANVIGADALDALPISLPLELIVHDPEVIAELFSRAEGAEGDGFALDALRFVLWPSVSPAARLTPRQSVERASRTTD